MKTVIVSAFLSLFATTAIAGEIAHIREVYAHTHFEQQPVSTIQECRNTAGGNALGGMIIGSLIGKGLTGDDQGAIAGAVIGGVIGADNGRQRCYDRVVYDTVEVIDYYEVTYTIHGQYRTVYSYRYYEPGDRVPLYMLLQN